MQVAYTNAKEAMIEVTVTKADGTVINYGTVSYWHKNPIKRFIWKFKK